ncbi:MAG: hypothetical protein H0V09_04775 [Gemmatimonadetes bacterium]|nr:hypothetical protein [Gemmatimonadota bacterium]
MSNPSAARRHRRRAALGWALALAVASHAGQAQEVPPDPAAAAVESGATAATGPVRVRYLLDASGSMRARFGEFTRLEAASAMVRALDGGLLRGAPRLRERTLWAYGARSHRLMRDCSDVTPLPRGRDGGLEGALGSVRPTGISPLVHALGRVLGSSRGTAPEAWVVFTDGSDSCGEDPCRWVERAVASGSRPRIYVVGLGLDAADAERLGCLTEKTSGYLLDLQPGASWGRPIGRLASAVLERGLLRLRVAEIEGADLQGRVYREGSSEPLRTIRADRREEVPAGGYRLVLETFPQLEIPYVEVLPGEERVVAVEDVARLTVRALSSDNEPLPARAALTVEGKRELERYLSAGQPVYVQPGRYTVRVEVGDSVLGNETLELGPGELRTVSMGGTGFVRARAAGLRHLAGLDVELQAYDPTRPAVVSPSGSAVPVPAGEYRIRVHSLPAYVQERLEVAPAETTAVVLRGLGILRVDLRDADARPLDVRVMLMRAHDGQPTAHEAPAATEDAQAIGPDAQPGAPDAQLAAQDSQAGPARAEGAGSVVGTFRSGVNQAVLAGTYDLLVETVPTRWERGVRVEEGSERVVYIGGAAPVPRDRAGQPGAIRSARPAEGT